MAATALAIEALVEHARQAEVITDVGVAVICRCHLTIRARDWHGASYGHAHHQVVHLSARGLIANPDDVEHVVVALREAAIRAEVLALVSTQIEGLRGSAARAQVERLRAQLAQGRWPVA